jgi:hypothetical protein
VLRLRQGNIAYTLLWAGNLIFRPYILYFFKCFFEIRHAFSITF